MTYFIVLIIADGIVIY